MNPPAPDGAPPRRISVPKYFKKPFLPAVPRRCPEAGSIVYHRILMDRILCCTSDGSQRIKNKNLNPLFPRFSTPSGIRYKNIPRYITATASAGTRMNQSAYAPANIPAQEITPAIMNNFPPSSCVFFQTVLLLNVHGVRIPTNQFCSACPRRNPM